MTTTTPPRASADNPNSTPSFPPINEAPFNLTDAELTEAWGITPQPQSEKETRVAFERIAGSAFTLYPEVQLRHPGGERLRIDYVGFDKSGQIKGPIGFELKPAQVGHGNFTDFSKAMSQACDYSRCRISSDVVTDTQDWFASSFKYIFLFPCPFQVYEFHNKHYDLSIPDLWAQGELKLAGKYGVGAIGYVPKDRRDWGLFLAGHPAYWLKSGPTDLATKHALISKVGSAR